MGQPCWQAFHFGVHVCIQGDIYIHHSLFNLTFKLLKLVISIWTASNLFIVFIFLSIFLCISHDNIFTASRAPYTFNLLPNCGFHDNGTMPLWIFDRLSSLYITFDIFLIVITTLQLLLVVVNKELLIPIMKSVHFDHFYKYHDVWGIMMHMYFTIFF